MNGYTLQKLKEIAEFAGVKNWEEIASIPFLVGKSIIDNNNYIGFEISESKTHHILGKYKGFWGGYYWFSNL